MAENNFITRYYIAIEKEDKKIYGLDDVCNLFDNTIQDFFYNFFSNELVKEENLIEEAKKELEKKQKKFFKFIDLEKEGEDTIYGKVVFSDFEEILTSLVSEDSLENNKAIKFIPQRRFFFMLKIKNIRNAADKNMNIAILLLHKRGSHSIKQIISEALSKKFKSQSLDLYFKAIEFSEELKELEKSEVKSVTVLEKIKIDDIPEKDEVISLGIKEIDRKDFLKIVPGTRNLTAIKNFIFKKEKSTFSLNSENKVMEALVKTKKGNKVITYTSNNGFQKIASVLLNFQDICTIDKKDIDWLKIKGKFKEEMEECLERISIDNWIKY